MADCKKSHIVIHGRRRHIAIKGQRRTHIHLGNASLLTFAPQEPTNLTITQEMGTAVDLSWTDTISNFESYSVFVEFDGALIRQIDNIQSTTATVEGLNEEGVYIFYVRTERGGILGPKSNEVTYNQIHLLFVPTNDGLYTLDSNMNALHTFGDDWHGELGLAVDNIRKKVYAAAPDELICFSINPDFSLTVDWNVNVAPDGTCAMPRVDRNGDLYVVAQDDGYKCTKVNPGDGSVIWRYDLDTNAMDLGFILHPWGILFGHHRNNNTNFIDRDGNEIVTGVQWLENNAGNNFPVAITSNGTVVVCHDGTASASSDRKITEQSFGNNISNTPTLIQQRSLGSGTFGGGIATEYVWTLVHRGGIRVLDTDDFSNQYFQSDDIDDIWGESQVWNESHQYGAFDVVGNFYFIHNADEKLKKIDVGSGQIIDESTILSSTDYDKVATYPAAEHYPWGDFPNTVSIESVTTDASDGNIMVEGTSLNFPLEYSLWQDGSNISGWAEDRFFHTFNNLDPEVYTVKVRDSLGEVEEQTNVLVGVPVLDPISVEGTDTTFTWSSLAGVDGYNVYISDDEGSTYNKQNSQLINDTEYTIEDVDVGEYDGYVVGVSGTTEGGKSNKEEFLIANSVTYRYYRLFVTANNGNNSWAGQSEFIFRDEVGSSDLSTSGSNASANTYTDPYLPSDAFDGDGSTGWAVNSPNFPLWIQYDFGSPTEIKQYGVGGYRSSSFEQSRCFKDWELQGSDNGSDWETIATEEEITNWSSGEIKYFLL